MATTSASTALAANKAEEEVPDSKKNLSPIVRRLARNTSACYTYCDDAAYDCFNNARDGRDDGHNSTADGRDDRALQSA